MAENRPPNRPVYPRARSSESYPNDRERANKARQAAEALFAPKPKPRVGEDAASAVRPAVERRKLAVIPMPPPTVPDRPDPAADGDAASAADREIPADHLSRIRTWLKYGMTIAEVAAVYGVRTDEIERILRQT